MSKEILFIINPIAGNGKKKDIVEKILKYLDTTLYTPQILYTKGVGDATNLARSSFADVVVAVGGDGTVNEVAKGIVGTDKVLGVIPCGSGDGFALHLGISRDIKNAINVINKGYYKALDYALADNEPFFCTAGLGIDALTAYEFAKGGKRGVWSYVSSALRIWKNFKPEQYLIDVDGLKLNKEAALITVANAGQWGNNARIASKASMEDGLLDVCIVSPFRTIHIPMLLIKLMSGKIHTSKRITILRGCKVVIERENEGATHFDGNSCKKGKQIVFQIIAGGINVLVPLSKNYIISNPE